MKVYLITSHESWLTTKPSLRLGATRPDILGISISLFSLTVEANS